MISAAKKVVKNFHAFDPCVTTCVTRQRLIVSYCTSSSNSKLLHEGYATLKGTSAYIDEFTKTVHIPASNYRSFQASPPDEVLRLSSLGIGTYLGGQDAKTDEAVSAAVIYSVTHGWNVIDTASNYRYGRAEVSIGKALDSLLSGNLPSKDPAFRPITREMLFISSKAGFTTGPLVKELLGSGLITSADVIQNMHCMHPEYIKASLHESLERMNLKTLDLLYLHNSAEMQLPAVGRAEFMKRLEVAFATLEAARAEGLIRYYGIATWDCFRKPPSEKSYLPLEEAVKAAEKIGGESHGFRFIQLPINATMLEAYAKPWQPVKGENKTLLQAAADLGIGVFTSGPLLQSQLVKAYTSQLDGIKELQPQRSTPGKLLQMVRSTPGVLTTLVGHKTPRWVEENLQISLTEPLSTSEFVSALEQMPAIV